MYESLLELDNIRLNFSSESLLVLNVALGLIMFGVALEIKVAHFQRVIANPKSTLIGLFSQFLLLPMTTFFIIVALRTKITSTVALGMILVASCPGGNISNFISNLAKGNVALSVSLTAIATFLAMFVTPFSFAFWGGLYTNYVSRVDAESLLRPLEINPNNIFASILVLLGIPLVVGMLANHYLPRLTRVLVKPLKIFSIIFFMGVVLLAFNKNYDFFVAHIHYVFIIVLTHNTLAFGSGYFLSTVFRLNKTDRRAITIETGIQNSGLALVLIFNPKIFPLSMHIGGMAFIAAWWGIWHILAGLSLAAVWSRKNLNRQF
ncbi:MAG: bile acid:sodium symporter family protein [Bacteroidales bacterium]|nr:bile acid:sodium symporter family protein [Bacteroidales bacterium]